MGHTTIGISTPHKIFLPLSLAVKVCGANVRPDRHKSDGSCDEAERSREVILGITVALAGVRMSRRKSSLDGLLEIGVFLENLAMTLNYY